MLFKNFSAGLIIGVTKDMLGLVTQLSINALTFQLADHY